MGQLFKTIRQLVADENYVIGLHASERLEERGILKWQVVVGLDDGNLIAHVPSRIRRSKFWRCCRMEQKSRRSGRICGSAE
jgi:hypothetical protein